MKRQNRDLRVLKKKIKYWNDVILNDDSPMINHNATQKSGNILYQNFA